MSDELLRFESFLAEKGLRFTKQRRAILEKVLSFDNHFCVDDLADWEEGKAYGVVTIYRTLALIVECGILEERDFGRGRKYYDRVHGRGHHEHLICRSCGEVREVWSEAIDVIQRELAGRIGFVPCSYDLRVFGRCASCAAV